MKIQDIIFLLIFAILIFKHKENSFVALGLVCFLLSIPFFYFWVFFTAERLIEYGVLLLLVEVLYKTYKSVNEKK